MLKFKFVYIRAPYLLFKSKKFNFDIKKEHVFT